MNETDEYSIDVLEIADMRPLHEEWVSGTIDGREYRILRCFDDNGVLVSFEDMENDVQITLPELLKKAHNETKDNE